MLAAGGSARMGTAKQLLTYDGAPLLKRAVGAALEAQCDHVIVVLGAHASVLRNEVSKTKAHIAVNQDWEEGMASSIRCGLAALDAMPSASRADAALLMLCDQPFVTAAVLDRLIETYRATRAPLVVSAYEAAGEETRGVPALFARTLFPELLSLRGAHGAKRVIERHAREAAPVAVPEAAFDVDTPDDYLKLQSDVPLDFS